MLSGAGLISAKGVYLDFERLTPGDSGGIREMSELATSIVREHYDPIVGRKQNDYMLQKFQSVEGITEQLECGYRYYFACVRGRRVGFMAFYPRGTSMYLSKLYLLKGDRGMGYGRQMVEFVKREAVVEGLSSIELNVNRYNGSVAVYEKMGFKRIRTEDNDIGNGYYMNDYVYSLTL